MCQIPFIDIKKQLGVLFTSIDFCVSSLTEIVSDNPLVANTAKSLLKTKLDHYVTVYLSFLTLLFVCFSFERANQ